VTSLLGHADRVVVFANTPRVPITPGECLTDGSPELGDCTFRNSRDALDQAGALLESARRAGAEVVDAQEWFCSQDRCPMVVGEYITLRDTHHMTREYAQALADPLGERLGLRGLEHR